MAKRTNGRAARIRLTAHCFANISAVLLPLCLAACGGGSAESTSSASVAAYNDLQAASGTTATTQTSNVCGWVVGPSLLQGLVTAVHDGDTLTVGSSTVRLAGIDAPELAQAYGAQARTHLANLTLGRKVKVAYANTDRYGRVVGAVFTDNCQYANLEQVSAGAAWFYRAYQCELSATNRNALDAAEESAQAGHSGLWADAAPLPPWVFRNGNDPVVPTCTSDVPIWPGNATPATTPTYTPPGNTGCYTITVNGYYRSNGTYVKPSTRKSAGCA